MKGQSTVLTVLFINSLSKQPKKWSFLGGEGGGVLPYMGYVGVYAAVKGMVFKQFTLGLCI